MDLGCKPGPGHRWGEADQWARRAFAVRQRSIGCSVSWPNDI